MATQLAERQADPITVFRQTLSTPAFTTELKMALPSHITVERFIRVAQTAVQQNPDLLNGQKVERRSLFGALVRAAQDGLLPDGREGAIVPFRGKAQWMPMVNGIMKKVRNSGEIASWEASAVYEKDQFQRLLGDDQRIYHEPFEDGDPGEVIGAYSIVTFKDGTKSRDYMPRWRIEKARDQNPIGKNSLMWTKFYDEGAIKTVIRHHSKRLPMSTDIDLILDRDESLTPPGGYSSKPDPEPPAPVAALNRLDAIEAACGDEPEPPVEPEVITEQAEELEEVIDAETGEITAPRNMLDQIEDAHPGTAIADAIIAELDDCIVTGAVDALMADRADDIAAMLDEDGVRVEVAADKRRQAIASAKGKAGNKETLV